MITCEEETSWLGVRSRKIYFSSSVLPFVSFEFLLSTHMTHSRTSIFLGLVHQTFNSVQLLTQSHGGDRALDNLCVTHPCLSVTQQGYITVFALPFNGFLLKHYCQAFTTEASEYGFLASVSFSSLSGLTGKTSPLPYLLPYTLLACLTHPPLLFPNLQFSSSPVRLKVSDMQMA